MMEQRRNFILISILFVFHFLPPKKSSVLFLLAYKITFLNLTVKELGNKTINKFLFRCFETDFKCGNHPFSGKYSTVPSLGSTNEIRNFGYEKRERKKKLKAHKMPLAFNL